MDGSVKYSLFGRALWHYLAAVSARNFGLSLLGTREHGVILPKLTKKDKTLLTTALLKQQTNTAEPWALRGDQEWSWTSVRTPGPSLS